MARYYRHLNKQINKTISKLTLKQEYLSRNSSNEKSQLIIWLSTEPLNLNKAEYT